jgi:hypothetical protein
VASDFTYLIFRRAQIVEIRESERHIPEPSGEAGACTYVPDDITTLVPDLSDRQQEGKMKGSTIFFIPTERISENCAELRFY